MTNQEKIFKLLALEGDCWHKVYNGEGILTCSCGAIKGKFYPPINFYKQHANPDLTTPDGVMWMLVRLPKWDRKLEFDDYILTKLDFDDNEFTPDVIRDVLTWLATDAKDGKAPALFNALVEFTEVKGV